MIKSMVIMGLFGLVAASQAVSMVSQPSSAAEAEIEKAVLEASRAAPQEDGESYQRVYEAFTRLMQNTANNSLGNVRRLVSRLNQLVGTTAPTSAGSTSTNAVSAVKTEQKQKQTVEENTEQILNRLDQVNKETDQQTLSKLNEDVSKLISTLNDSYLRNIRRVIERVNKVVGQPSAETTGSPALHQSGDRLDDLHSKQPGFPGWDELIVAVDRVQKSLAHFVRSSTRLVTSG